MSCTVFTLPLVTVRLVLLKLARPFVLLEAHH
jgi:hypothetical protein